MVTSILLTVYIMSNLSIAFIIIMMQISKILPNKSKFRLVKKALVEFWTMHIYRWRWDEVHLSTAS